MKVDKRHENKGRPTKEPKEKIVQFWAYAPQKYVDSVGGDIEAGSIASELFCEKVKSKIKQNEKVSTIK